METWERLIQLHYGKWISEGGKRKRKSERQITHTSAVRDDTTELINKLETAKSKTEWLKIECLS